MPVPALSLLGFMDVAQASTYLRNRCQLRDSSDDACRAFWQEAVTRLGAPADSAGKPDMRDISADCHQYLSGVPSLPRFNMVVDGMPWSFRLVEIDPLLAFQFHIETDRSGDLCKTIGQQHKATDLLPICLPHALEDIPIQVGVHASGVLLKSHSMNVRLIAAGLIGDDQAQRMKLAGIAFGVAPPLVQVVCFQDRCYLKNGYHRVYGLRKAGATHVPCVFLEANDYNQIGSPGGGATFERALLESENAPTCGHFAQGRACDVELKRVARYVSVTWSEYVLPEP